MNGYTMLELLVVLSIAGGAAAIVSPQVSSGRERIAVHSSARELATALRGTRAEAISRHRSLAWTPEADGTGYRFGANGAARRLADGVRLDLRAAPAEIRFYPDGSSTGGRVTLAAGNLRSVVEVDWVSGRVRSHD